MLRDKGAEILFIALFGAGALPASGARHGAGLSEGRPFVRQRAVSRPERNNRGALMHVRYRQFRDSFARRDWLEWQDARCAEIAAGEKTMTEVAAQCGACEATVRQWMRKWREEQGGSDE